MAANMVYKWTKTRPLACTDPAVPATGDPVLFGQLPGVALTTEDAAGNTTVALDGVFKLSVKGTSGSNAAITAGDKIYYVTGDTPKLSVTTSGVLFGIALENVSSGATATIKVEVTR
jgi:predicted RecA/RadA family phage recombinase